MKKLREITCKLLELVDMGKLDAKTVLEAALMHLSENEVKDMAEVNEFISEDEDVMSDFNYTGSHWHY